MKYHFDKPTKIYLAAASCGDGSYTTHFFESNEAVELLSNEDSETYGCWEGGMVITVKGDFDTGSSYSKIRTLAEIKKELNIDDED